MGSSKKSKGNPKPGTGSGSGGGSQPSAAQTRPNNNKKNKQEKQQPTTQQSSEAPHSDSHHQELPHPHPEKRTRRWSLKSPGAYSSKPPPLFKRIPQGLWNRFKSGFVDDEEDTGLFASSPVHGKGKCGSECAAPVVEGKNGAPSSSQACHRKPTTASLKPPPLDVQLVQFLDRFFVLPSAVERAIFYVALFFTRKRVIIVVAVMALLVMFNTMDIAGKLSSDFVVDDGDRPGLTFADRHTIHIRRPVVIIPGFITSGLEVWNAPECAHNYFASTFRQRMFGSQMLFLVLRDPICFLKLFSMDMTTGMDPEKTKVRPDAGFGSADYVLPGYWVWAKILLNLADIGYDPQSMALLSYDWRMSPRMSNKRDGFFYLLRNQVQFLVEKNDNKRAIVFSHSYGTTVAIDFFRWTEEHHPGWMEKYVDSFVNLGGTTMGLSKAVVALVTGDMRDTLMLPRPVRAIFDSVVAPSARYNAFRTWSCLAAMFPYTCDGLFPNLFTLPNGTKLAPRATMQFAIEKTAESGHTSTSAFLKARLNKFDELPILPQAPSTTVYCLYGVSKMAEQGYSMQEDGTVDMTSVGENTMNGVLLGNGDGTVPLQSLGYMCRAPNGWVKNVKRVVTHEVVHDGDVNSTINIRGSSASADHVDMLGNYAVIELILMIVSGNGDKVKDRIHSNIDEIVRNSDDCLRVPSRVIEPLRGAKRVGSGPRTVDSEPQDDGRPSPAEQECECDCERGQQTP